MLSFFLFYFIFFLYICKLLGLFSKYIIDFNCRWLLYGCFFGTRYPCIGQTYTTRTFINWCMQRRLRAVIKAEGWYII